MISPFPSTAAGDPFDRRRGLHAPPLLEQFSAVGVLEPADVHSAVAGGRLLGETDAAVLLAVALAVRGFRQGHVRIDLTRVRERIAVEELVTDEIDRLPWPEPAAWLGAVAASPLCGRGEPSRPLVLSGPYLYVQRYWRYERQLACALNDRAARPPRPLGPRQVWLEKLAAVLPALDRDQLQAARLALTQDRTVITGGPGTGKTQTVARLLAVLLAAASDLERPLPAVAVAAPTGKAAAVLKGKLQEAADKLSLPEGARAHLRRVECSTIHRLLGYGTGRGTSRHGPADLLPYDFVVVDEMSMVPLSLAARLLLAIRPNAQLVLVGDADQLVSIEAGSVLRDIVEAARPGASTGALGDHVVVLPTDYRVEERNKGIKQLREAIRDGHPDKAIRVLRDGRDGVSWHDTALPQVPPGGRLATVLAAWLRENLPGLAEDLADQAKALHDLARKGDAPGALARLEARGLLCAHRAGAYGALTWGSVVEHLAEEHIRELQRKPPAGSDREELWYPGRPVMVTTNDYGLRLFNGDKGVAVGAGPALRVAFRESGRGGERVRPFGPAQLEDIQTVHAMTIHKSQGSEFDEVVVLLPDEGSRLLTRQLLYTAVTRARNAVTLLGTKAALEKAIGNPVDRASGLKELLCGEEGSSAPSGARPMGH
jgi:exodeoxyribonuclease V alpha subunit